MTQRSNAIEITLEVGTYLVRPRIIARKLDTAKSVNHTIATASGTRQDKLLKTAYECDLAHAKVSGWRAVNEMVHEKRFRRLQNRRQAPATKHRDESQEEPTAQDAQSTTDYDAPPAALHSEDVLGYDDWDAVAALGLRVLMRDAKASIELKRHKPEDLSSKPDVQPPQGTTMSDYESDEDTEDGKADEDAAQAAEFM